MKYGLLIKILNYYNIGKNISKILKGKHSQKLLGHAKEFTRDAPKTYSKRVIQKTAEATSDLIGSKIADRITKVSRSSPQNTSETIANEHDKEMPKERYSSSEGRHKVIDDLRLM